MQPTFVMLYDTEGNDQEIVEERRTYQGVVNWLLEAAGRAENMHCAAMA